MSNDAENNKTGVLVVNLGTPDAPTPAAVRRYLAEFLSDPRVVESPRLLWWLLLHGIILRIRPGPVSNAYKKVWTDQGSPLLSITNEISEALQLSLNSSCNNEIITETAMCYGKPSISSAMKKLAKYDIDRLLILPLYPQYSATTTAAALDLVFAELKLWRFIPELRAINNYYSHDTYIEAIASSIQTHWDRNPQSAKLLFSFHGLPVSYVEAGDPYSKHCEQTAKLVAAKLNLKNNEWKLCYQSRFGKKLWLQPYTDKTLIQWAQDGIESVDVICPGFAVDCLETLEEINMQNRRFFLENGGKSFAYIPALNSSPAHVQALTQIIMDCL